MSINDIAVRLARRQVILGDGFTFTYGSAPVPHNKTVCCATVLRSLLATPPSGQVSSWKSICCQTGYNSAIGLFQARVNMGPVEPPPPPPPQRKGRLTELQQKFDELENFGVLQRTEDLGISVEYLNPSFLVNKPNGGYRLITVFTDVSRYSKPQSSLMPDVDSTLRHIVQWKYLIATDLTSAFYQNPLARESMKYCGVTTPYRVSVTTPELPWACQVPKLHPKS